jgi:hypothetical protein
LGCGYSGIDRNRRGNGGQREEFGNDEGKLKRMAAKRY